MLHERRRKKKEKKADAYHHVNQLLVYVLEVVVGFLYYRSQYSIFIPVCLWALHLKMSFH